MHRRQPGNPAIAALALLNVVLWLVFVTLPDDVASLYAFQYAAEVCSSTAVILIAMALVLSARLRFLERHFGGLDKMYQTHKHLAVLAFVLLAVHFVTIPDSGLLIVGKPLGMLALVGLVGLALLTVAPRLPLISRLLHLPYHRWRITHKLLGLFFVAGVAHYLHVGALSTGTVPGRYMLLLAVVGIAAYAYKQLLARFLEPYRPHVVEQVKRLNGTTVEVCLRPSDRKVDFKAGQFVFVRFTGDRHLHEAHPFTVSSSPREELVRLTIKASGDWTRYLVRNLKPDTAAAVYGGFGMFDYKAGGRDQLWIAGGIGVTPFLSWIRELDGRPGVNVDFFWAVRGAEDAVFLDEFRAVAEKHDNLHVFVRYGAQDGNLSVDQIDETVGGNLAQKHIYMCGPIRMMEAFAARFRRLGVPAAQIHYEEFNFR
jgi:predicted ferric reductase